MEVWNNKNIVKPPNYTLEYTSDECQNTNIDECIISLKSALSSLEVKLQNETLQACFNMETMILSILLSQTQQHRVEKFYGQLKKMYRCVKHWQEMKLDEYAAKLSKMMPDCQGKLRSIRIPSRQMFEYLMVRLYGAYQLLIALETCCRETAPLLLAKLNIGHDYRTVITFLAIIARFRVLSLDFAAHLARTYDDIYPWIKHLKGPIVWDFVSENSASLVGSLKIHCKNVESDENLKETRNRGLAICELNVLDIFDNGEDMDLVNKMMSENQGFQGNLSILPNKNNKHKTKSIHSKSKKELKKNMASWRNLVHTDVESGNKSAGKQWDLKEKEDILSLLSLFDENVSGKPCDSASGRHSSLSNSKLGPENSMHCEESKCTVALDEDIGEVTENGGVLVKNKSKKRKMNENKNIVSKKTKIRKLHGVSITKQV